MVRTFRPWYIVIGSGMGFASGEEYRLWVRMQNPAPSRAAQLKPRWSAAF